MMVEQKSPMGIKATPFALPYELPLRGEDACGAGHYGAPRGARIHRGIDFECPDKAIVHSHVAGKVTKLGYPYSHDLSFRYVEIADRNRFKHRFFYVLPTVELGERITIGQGIGLCQDIASKWGTKEKPMKNHIHYEVMRRDEYYDPEDWL